MEKYGVNQEQVEELVKLGVCATEEEARKLAAAGKAEGMIKEAKKSTNEQDMDV
jgi:hypothetical protein